MSLVLRSTRRVLSTALIAALTFGLFSEISPLQAQDPGTPRAEEGGERPERSRRSRSTRTRTRTVGPEAPIGSLGQDENGSPKVTAGRLPVRTLLRFIEESTDRLLLFPTLIEDPHFSADITVEFLSDVENFEATTARTILATNGYEFVDAVLDNGRKVTHVSHRMSRMPAPPMDIQKVYGPKDALPETGEGHGVLVVDLEHAAPQGVIMALRQVLEITGSTSTGRVIIVAVPESGQILASASVATLRTVRQLAMQLDKEPRVPTSQVAPNEEEQKTPPRRN